MADPRAPPRPPSTALGPSRSRVAGGVRRNLFQSQLTRRPTASSTSSTDTASTVRPGGMEFETTPENQEIVVRDGKGDIPIFDPLPMMDDEDGAVDERDEGRRERERLSEMVRQLGFGRGPAQGDEEFLDALKISLRAKVAALDEDNWMYEAEQPQRDQR